MNKESLKNLIKEYLKTEYPRIVHKGEIGKKAIFDWGYENENCGRRLRELKNAGVVEVIYNEKHEAMYRYIVEEDIKVPTVMNVNYKQDSMSFGLRAY